MKCSRHAERLSRRGLVFCWNRDTVARPTSQLSGACVCLEDALEPLEVFAVGASHRAGQERYDEPGETGRFPSVSKRHRGSALCGVLPGVGRLHREGPLGCPHHEPLTGDHLCHFIGIGKAAAEELGDEGDPGANRERLRGFPFDRLDLLVPGRRVVGVGRVLSDLAAGPLDFDLGLDVDRHSAILGLRLARRNQALESASLGPSRLYTLSPYAGSATRSALSTTDTGMTLLRTSRATLLRGINWATNWATLD